MNGKQPVTQKFDVIVVGYGPTGMVLASLLGQRGHQVAVVERWPQLYGRPRLTHIDGETARLVSLVADGEHALRDAWRTPHYYWTNGKGQLLMDVADGNTRRMIWDDHLSVHQPHIEEAIHERIESMPNVKLFRGYLATTIEQDSGGVRIMCAPWRREAEAFLGDSLLLEAPYLVGADGSKSFVRQAVGVDRIDFGFNERWLCLDTEPLRPLPAKFDANAVQVCDPRRGYMFIPIGKKRQRFEFALLPGESTEEMQTIDAAYRFLKEYHGLEREDVSLIRNLVYTFECRLAKSWRVGRVFLAGDAAHTNPPYLGQGACSGMRDSANLAWKLDLVLRGLASDSLLDTYEQERRPHAQKLMLDARSLGLVANTSNPVKAAVRDMLFKLNLTPKPKFPVLTSGVLAMGGARPIREAGTLPSQGRLTIAGRTMRFDEHVGFNFSLVVRAGAARDLPLALHRSLRFAGASLIELGNRDLGSPASAFTAVIDTDGVYGRLLDQLDADAAIIRPDFVLYGYAARDHIVSMVEEFLSQLHFASGVALTPQLQAA